MKKNSILLYAITLLIAFCFTPSVMAKEKKVKYLGHNYRGEVNEKKIPAGEGTMNVNGLLIKGDFDDHSAKDAEVWRTDYMGTSNTKFEGTITYDDSDNIVLKTGGVLTIKYYLTDYKGSTSLVSANPYYVTDILKEDRVVNSSNFEPKELKIPYDYKIKKIDFNKLNPPVFKTSYTVGLTHVNNCMGQKIDMDVFCIYPRNDKEPIHISDYKDGEGRIWDYYYTPNRGDGDGETCSVKYPNGSYCEYSSNNPVRNYNCSWEIHYPDGKIVKSTWSDHVDYGRAVYDLGKIQFKRFEMINLYTAIDIFADNLNKEKFVAPAANDFEITSSSFDFEKLSNKEIEKIIREEFEPYIEKFHACGTPNGIYKNGKFTSKKQIAAAKAKEEREEAAKEQAAYNELCRLFGQKYVDAALRGRIIVGMPEKLMLKTKKCRLKATNGNTKIYNVLEMREYNSAKRITFKEGITQTVYVSNGKVTSIVNR